MKQTSWTKYICICIGIYIYTTLYTQSHTYTDSTIISIIIYNYYYTYISLPYPWQLLLQNLLFICLSNFFETTLSKAKTKIIHQYDVIHINDILIERDSQTQILLHCNYIPKWYSFLHKKPKKTSKIRNIRISYVKTLAIYYY